MEAKCSLCTNQCFPKSGITPRELDGFESFMSNSLPVSSNFVSKNLWVGFRYFTYFPEEFLAQLYKFPPLSFSCLANSRRQECFVLLSDPQCIHVTPLRCVLVRGGGGGEGDGVENRPLSSSDTYRRNTGMHTVALHHELVS